jgi:hypothetical protein
MVGVEAIADARLSSLGYGALALLAAMGVGLAVVQSVRLWWLRASASLAARARAARGIAGERRAEKLVHARGYDVVARQARARWRLLVDGREVSGELRADMLVSRATDGARFVAEVKTGALAPRIDSAATRRQLLEYLLAFDVQGVLLVDAERDAVHEIVFALPVVDDGEVRARPLDSPTSGSLASVLCVALGAGLGAAACLLAGWLR